MKLLEITNKQLNSIIHNESLCFLRHKVRITYEDFLEYIVDIYKENFTEHIQYYNSKNITFDIIEKKIKQLVKNCPELSCSLAFFDNLLIPCRKILIKILKSGTNGFEQCVDKFIDQAFCLPKFYTLKDPFGYAQMYIINDKLYFFPSESVYVIFMYFLKYMWYRIDDIPNELQSELSCALYNWTKNVYMNGQYNLLLHDFALKYNFNYFSNMNGTYEGNGKFIVKRTKIFS